MVLAAVDACLLALAFSTRLQGSGCRGLEPSLRPLCIHASRALPDHQIQEAQRLHQVMQTVGKKSDSLGCEVCRPAVGSILSSLYNDWIMNPSLRQTQDTNDRYLANMQRDGTYSVVPRMAAGEVTPAVSKSSVRLQKSTVSTPKSRWSAYRHVLVPRSKIFLPSGRSLSMLASSRVTLTVRRFVPSSRVSETLGAVTVSVTLSDLLTSSKRDTRVYEPPTSSREVFQAASENVPKHR